MVCFQCLKNDKIFPLISINNVREITKQLWRKLINRKRLVQYMLFFGQNYIPSIFSSCVTFRFRCIKLIMFTPISLKVPCFMKSLEILIVGDKRVLLVNQNTGNTYGSFDSFLAGPPSPSNSRDGLIGVFPLVWNSKIIRRGGVIGCSRVIVVIWQNYDARCVIWGDFS